MKYRFICIWYESSRRWNFAMCFTPPSTRTGLVATLSCGRIICGRHCRVHALCSIWGQCHPQEGSVALHPHSCALPPLPTTCYWITSPSTFPPPPFVPSLTFAGTLNDVLALYSHLLPQTPDFITCKSPMTVTPLHAAAWCTHIFTNADAKRAATTEETSGIS